MCAITPIKDTGTAGAGAHTSSPSLLNPFRNRGRHADIVGPKAWVSDVAEMGLLEGYLLPERLTPLGNWPLP